MEEEEEDSGGENKLFVTLAIALIGLLVLGLLGVGAVFIIRQNLNEQSIAVQPTPTILIRLPNPTATFTPIPVIPTNTPVPTPTNTPVLVPGGQEAASGSGGGNGGNNGQAAQNQPTAQPSPTRTPVPGGAAAGKPVVPETGIGGLQAVLIAVGLAGVLFIARRLRMSA